MQADAQRPLTLDDIDMNRCINRTVMGLHSLQPFPTVSVVARLLLAAALAAMLAAGPVPACARQAPVAPAMSMANPAIDDPGKPWCYLQHSTTLVGVPYMPDAIQVTYDGALYTGHAELCFFYGRPLRPVLVRQKTWYEGWIPIVQYAWTDSGFAYQAEMFGFPLDGEGADNTLQFVRISVTNTGHEAARPLFAAATRSTGLVYRFGGGQFSPDWSFTMAQGRVLRQGKLVYTYPEGGHPASVYGRAYAGPFRAGAVQAGKSTPLAMISFSPLLKPGATAHYTFKMPRLPVDSTDRAFLRKIAAADYETYKKKTIDYWKAEMLEGRMRIQIPEKRVNDAVRASLVHMMLATRMRDGKRFMTDGLPYPNLFLASFIQHAEAFDFLGFREFADQTFPEVYAKQDSTGLFYDDALLHGRKSGASQGQTLQSLCLHYLITRDLRYIDTVYPKIRQGVAWIRDAVMGDSNHLMPPVWPYDAEMILGYYTSHNLWALLAIRSSIRVARALGREEDAAAWTRFERQYKAALLRAVQATYRAKGYIPPGLYDYTTGPAAREGFAEWQTNQEWENMLLLCPSELLAPGDPVVDATLSRIRRDRYREGIMTYRIFLHQYITVNMMEQELAAGMQKDALVDLYNVLLHLGPTYEGFENLVKPWQDREVSPDCPTPHAWAASKLVGFIRSMLVREYGGEAGMDERQRDLYVFSLLSPAWCEAGNTVSFADARTEMGNLSASMTFTDSGAEVSLRPAFRSPPHRIVLTIPYFVHLQGFHSDATEVRQIGQQLFFSPDVRKITLTWEKDPQTGRGTFADLLKRYRSESVLTIAGDSEVIRPGRPFLLPGEQNYPPAPLSFALVRKAFVHEYHRRYQAFRQRGGQADTLAAPPLVTGK